MYDLLIVGGDVVSPSSTQKLDVAVDGEKIVAIQPAGTLERSAAKIVDASGCLVIPGGVDPHMHYKMVFDPIVTEGPEYSAGSAWGGTTTVVDFVFHEPPSTVVDSISAKRADFDGQIAVDYGLHVILTKNFGFEDIEQLGDVIRNGIPTIKTMMTYGYQSDDGQRFGAMEEVAKQGGMSVVHAEDDAIANWLTAKYIREGKVHGAYISETRGSIVEEAAVRRALFLAESTGSPLYVLHMASGKAIEVVAEAQARGVPVYAETLTTYLSFSQDDLWDESPVVEDGKTYLGRGMLYNNYPTIKTKMDRDMLWTALADGRVSTVGTDHSASLIKDRFELMGATLDTFVQAGQSSTELRVPLLYHQGVAGGQITVNRWVEAACTNPAKLMGLWPRKGELMVGSDADIVVFDPAKTWTVHWEDLHMRAQYSLWDGLEMNGRVRDTVLRGTMLVENDEWVGSKTSGKFLERKLMPDLIRPNPNYSLLFSQSAASTSAAS